MCYQVLKNNNVKYECDSKYDAIGFARRLAEEGFTGSIRVEQNGTCVYSEEN